MLHTVHRVSDARPHFGSGSDLYPWDEEGCLKLSTVSRQWYGQVRALNSRVDRLRPSLCAEPPFGLCCRATMATQAMQAMQPWKMVWPITMPWPTECTLPHWVPSRYLAKVAPPFLLVLHEATGRVLSCLGAPCRAYKSLPQHLHAIKLPVASRLTVWPLFLGWGMKYCAADLTSTIVQLQARHHPLLQRMAWPPGASSQQAGGPIRSNQQARLATWSMSKILAVPMSSLRCWGSCACKVSFRVLQARCADC